MRLKLAVLALVIIPLVSHAAETNNPVSPKPNDVVAPTPEAQRKKAFAILERDFDFIRFRDEQKQMEEERARLKTARENLQENLRSLQGNPADNVVEQQKAIKARLKANEDALKANADALNKSDADLVQLVMNKIGLEIQLPPRNL